jgi:hypothetical protein
LTVEHPDAGEDIRPAPRHCELCSVRNFAVGGRTSDGTFHPAYEVGIAPDTRAKPPLGEKGWCGKTGPEHFLRIFRVICTRIAVRRRRTGELVPRLLCQRCASVVRKDAERAAEARAA